MISNNDELWLRFGHHHAHDMRQAVEHFFLLNQILCLFLNELRLRLKIQIQRLLFGDQITLLPLSRFSFVGCCYFRWFEGPPVEWIV